MWDMTAAGSASVVLPESQRLMQKQKLCLRRALAACHIYHQEELRDSTPSGRESGQVRHCLALESITVLMSVII